MAPPTGGVDAEMKKMENEKNGKWTKWKRKKLKMERMKNEEESRRDMELWWENEERWKNDKIAKIKELKK